MHDRIVGHDEAALRWDARPIIEQLAHVGSEVERAFRARAAGQQMRFEYAFSRALQLFDLTAADERWRGHRRREILRAREEFCRLAIEGDEPTGSENGLRRYFHAFAAAARRDRG